MSYVLDASAVLKLLFDEEHSPAYRRWHFDTLRAEARFYAPTNLPYEVGNAIRYAPIDASVADRARMRADALAGIELVAIDQPEQHAPLTFYDAAYIDVAIQRRAAVVTYDAAMLEAATDAGLEVSTPA